MTLWAQNWSTQHPTNPTKPTADPLAPASWPSPITQPCQGDWGSCCLKKNGGKPPPSVHCDIAANSNEIGDSPAQFGVHKGLGNSLWWPEELMRQEQHAPLPRQSHAASGIIVKTIFLTQCSTYPANFYVSFWWLPVVVMNREFLPRWYPIIPLENREFTPLTAWLLSQFWREKNSYFLVGTVQDFYVEIVQ